ncbi:hypothetical protein BOX15_Mlig020400g2, partial [Macrostomum lignano]
GDFDRLSSLVAELESRDTSDGNEIEDLVDLTDAEPAQLLQHLASEDGHRRPQELRLVFAVATHCLAALASRSATANQRCQALVESLVNDHLGSVYRALDPANSAGVVKSALRCLAAMASCDASSARTLLHSIDFGAKRWQTLARRRNPADSEDIRHCCVQLGVAFLLAGGGSGGPIVRAFLDRAADFASLLLDRLEADKPSTLLLLLPALSDRLMSPGFGVSKTQKARLFGRRQLSSLAKLLTYTTPTVSSVRHRTAGEEDLAMPVDEEDDSEGLGESALAVRESAHRLLRRLGTSRRDGILFRRGENPLLCHLLLGCLARRIVSNGRCRRLAAGIARRCPELTARLTTEVLAPLLPPRPTPGWLAAADCLAAVWGVDDGDAGDAEEDGDGEAARIALAVVVKDAAQLLSSVDKDAAATLLKGLLVPAGGVLEHLAAGLALADGADGDVTKDATATVRSRCRRIRRILARRLAFAMRVWRRVAGGGDGAGDEDKSTIVAEVVSLSGDPLGLVTKATELADAGSGHSDEAEALVAKAVVGASSDGAAGGEASKASLTSVRVDHGGPAAADEADEEERLAEELPACSCDLADISERRQAAAARIAGRDGQSALSVDSWLRFCRKSLQTEPAAVACPIIDAICIGADEDSDGNAAAAVLKLALDNPVIRQILLSTEDSTTESDVANACPRLLDAVLTMLCRLTLRMSSPTPPPAELAIRLAGPLMLHYVASLSRRDQLIVSVVHRLRRSLPADLSQCCWAGRLAECRRFQPDLSSRLFACPPPAGILAQLEPRRILYTALHFPLDRPWLSHPKPFAEPSKPGLYDPCWLLPLLCRLLPSGLEASAAVRHHCLALAIAALSSHSERVRLLALTVLANLHSACSGQQAQRFPERDQTRYLIDVVRYTLTSATRRLPYLIGLFLARCAETMLRPQQRMYSLLWKFLTARSSVQLNAAPELWRFLMSDHVDHRVERQWLLNLFAQGVRDLEDYRLLERSFAVKTLLAVYPALDGTAKCLTLQLLCRLASLRPAAVSLVNRHQLTVWLSSVACGTADSRQLVLCRRLINLLWSCLLGSRSADSLPEHFVSQMRCLVSLPAFSDCLELKTVRDQIGDWPAVSAADA